VRNLPAAAFSFKSFPDRNLRMKAAASRHAPGVGTPPALIPVWPASADAAEEYKQMVDTSTALKITDQSFDGVVAKGVSVVDFWAEWCMPCRIQGPIVEKVAKKMAGRVNVCKLDVDENPASAQRYGVAGIPSLIFFKDGEEAARLIGVQNEGTIVKTLESLLA
jgi:thioredoxin 1